jgi:hypothetical protein
MRSFAGRRLASWAFARVAAPAAICGDPANITIAKLIGASSRHGRRRPHRAFRSTRAMCGGQRQGPTGMRREPTDCRRPEDEDPQAERQGAGRRRRSKAGDRFWQGILPRSATLIVARKVNSRDRLSSSTGWLRRPN